jgi:hypothetical protein
LTLKASRGRRLRREDNDRFSFSAQKAEKFPLGEMPHVQTSDRGKYCVRKRSGIGPGSPKHQGKLIMFTKIAKSVAAALVLASSSIAWNSTASAGPGAHQFPTSQEQAWMERASRTTDGGGQ